MAIRITMELDYPTIGEAFEKNTNLSTLVSSSKCLEFSTKTEVEDVNKFIEIKNKKYQEYIERFKDNQITSELEEALKGMANQYACDNFYYHSFTEKIKKKDKKENS